MAWELKQTKVITVVISIRNIDSSSSGILLKVFSCNQREYNLLRVTNFNTKQVNSSLYIYKKKTFHIDECIHSYLHMFHKTLKLIFKGCIIQTEVWNTMISKDRDGKKKSPTREKNLKIDRGAGNFRFHSLPFINTSKTHAFDCVLKFWKMVVGGMKNPGEL